MKKINLLLFFLAICLTAIGQNKISGSVVDQSGNPLPGANVSVVGTNDGATTDLDGNYSFDTSEGYPVSVEISFIGYNTTVVSHTSSGALKTKLEESSQLLDEVVFSASRKPESIRESAVSIERMDIKAMKNTTAATFYDGLENLKGVDINTNSLTYKSVNTRGFATFANTRFMQLVDGMDNSSPALNFPMGNLLGMNDMDVKSVEILPGASSALYGANAFNGILFMTSKSPFDYEGVSFYTKGGVTVQDAAGTNGYYDAGFRVAKIFSDKFAAKFSASYMEGEEWHATDNTDYNVPGQTRENWGYDGLNTYGDEVATNLNIDELAGLPIGTINSALGNGNTGAYTPFVSRTGYNENELMDYNASSLKADIALHWRPSGEGLEIMWNSKYGNGNTLYQGTNRYAIRDFVMHQHKLEIRDDNFFVRGYYTGESAGDSYDTRFAAININRSWLRDQPTKEDPVSPSWFGKYVEAFAGAVLVGGADESTAHALARAAADTGRILPGTVEFNNTLAGVTQDPDLASGAKFTDSSSLIHFDGNYNFKNQIDFMDIQVGASFRQYSLNSDGTIFTDYDGPIKYKEYGIYTQMEKKLFDDKLKLIGSLRYDEADDFEGSFTPKASFVYSPDDAKNHNIRGSFQKGFRNPTTQDLYIGLDAGRAILMGSSERNLDRYTTTVSNDTETFILNGGDAYSNAFSLSSVSAGAPAKAVTELIKPERVTAYELGYRGFLGGLSIDMSGYFNQYEDFIGNRTVLVPFYGQADFSDGGVAAAALAAGDYKPFQVYTNSKADISSYGLAIGLDKGFDSGYKLGINYSLNKFDFDQASDPDYEAQFNTPEHRVKFSFGNPRVFKRVGFNVNARWNDEYLWQSAFADATIPANWVLDAQMSYTLPDEDWVVKLGGTNIGGNEYTSAPGVGATGSIYYLSLTFNQ